MFFKKWYLPWLAADLFETEALYQKWLKKRHKRFTDLRMAFLVITAILLLTGYILDCRPFMIAAIAPLLLVLLLTLSLNHTEQLLEPDTE